MSHRSTASRSDSNEQGTVAGLLDDALQDQLRWLDQVMKLQTAWVTSLMAVQVDCWRCWSTGAQQLPAWMVWHNGTEQLA